MCGIPFNKVNWDYRTNVGDGGRDIEINIASNNKIRQFIPQNRSFWSIKSGKDGLEPSTLGKEISQHPKVLNYLKNNGSFIWCVAMPASNNDRDKLRDKIDDLSKEHKFDKNLVQFLFRDTITVWIKMHLGIIPIHFPSLPHRWKTIKEWAKGEKFFKVPWVNFSNRSDLISRITNHFYSTENHNILHLVGQSGIGKSRTVYEACSNEKVLESIVYFESMNIFILEYEDYITRSEGLHTMIVIDDVSIEEWEKLNYRLSEYKERIRIVTIGPIPKGKIGYYEEILVVAAPNEIDNISKVIQSYDMSLLSDQADEIAKWCNHDLRLALLLTEANKRDPGFRNKPILNVQEVFERVLKLYRTEIGDINKFREYYEIFSLFIDFGFMNKYRNELAYLAEFFQKSETEMDKMISLANNCGLGNSRGDFFEATPRALARFVFEYWAWNIIKPSVPKFISGMPTYQMQKRFIERGQECSEKLREEVNSALAGWFREEFPEYNINLIFSREASRVFETYTELDPENGLAWLKKSVEIAPVEKLINFDGKTDGSGGWRGRRQVVWLCEHLACFPEYFYDCEAILFRLALFETENDIGNNSTQIWQGLFLPMMSWTSIPFKDRLDLLLKRLSNANINELYLVTNACVKLFQEHISRMIPPKVVGGRLTPEEWRPKTYKELYDIKKDAANRIICAVKYLSPEKQDIPIRLLIENIRRFLRNDCFDLLNNWLTFQTLNEEQIRLLRIKLDEYINFLEINLESDKNERFKKELKTIINWRSSLDPTTLESQIKEVTGRGYWSHRDKLNDNEKSKIYEVLAENTINNIHVLDNLWDWFNSKDAISSRFFGEKLGYLDYKHLLYSVFMPKLLIGLSIDLIDGYISGVLKREGCIPEFISNDLDNFARIYPRQLIIITINSDCSERGFKRLLECIPLAGENVSGLLFNIALNPWSSYLSDIQKVDILRLLISLTKNDDQYAYKISLNFLSLWNHDKKERLDEPLASVSLNILKDCLNEKHVFDDYDWNKVMSMLPDTLIIEKIDILTSALVNWESGQLRLQDNALKLLIDVAKQNPNEVMQSLGSKINDKKYKDIFFISVFRGLFEAIELNIVQKWVADSGIEAGRAIARHILSPESTDNVPDYIPQLTEWILTEFENDDRFFREFCAGRHSFETFWGSASDRYEGIYIKVAPYLNHKLRRIREWAKYEIDRAKKDIKWDENNDAEFERG